MGAALLQGGWAAAATLAAPGLRLWLARRAGRGKELPERMAERWGEDAAPRPPGRLLWMHAASVGETLSVLPVLGALGRQAPDLHVLLTTGTVTSAALLRRRLPEAGLARVLHRFAPWDVPGWVARFLGHWRPDAACFVESELWPNMLAACRARAIPLLLLNARLSARSAARWRRAPALARSLLGAFAAVQARSAEDAARLRALGAGAVSAPGDLKFAADKLPADPAELARLRGMLRGRPVWLAASTHPGEEAQVLDAHRRIAAAHPALLTVIAPRHPERGAAIAALAGQGPDAPAATRRAAGGDPTGAVWVVDTLGELGLLYRLAGAAFIGGSLVPHGGQNPLEAARLGCPVAAGPHMGNFAEAVAALEAAGALARVSDAATLAHWADGLLRDPDRRRAAGAAAAGAADRWADLPERSAAALLALLGR